MCGGLTRSWSHSSMSAKRSPGGICGRSLMVRRSLPYDATAAPSRGRPSSFSGDEPSAGRDAVGRSLRLSGRRLLDAAAAVVGRHRLALQLDVLTVDDTDLRTGEAGVRGVGVAERNGARTLRQTGLDRLDDAVAGRVVAGGLQRLGERVPDCHPVE